jgi:hypothetical protein
MFSFINLHGIIKFSQVLNNIMKKEEKGKNKNIYFLCLFCLSFALVPYSESFRQKCVNFCYNSIVSFPNKKVLISSEYPNKDQLPLQPHPPQPKTQKPG